MKREKRASERYKEKEKREREEGDRGGKRAI